MDGGELRAWREGHGLSIRELAALLGVSFQSVWKWEQGQHAPPGYLLPLALERLDDTRAAPRGGGG